MTGSLDRLGADSLASGTIKSEHASTGAGSFLGNSTFVPGMWQHIDALGADSLTIYTIESEYASTGAGRL